MNDQATPAKVRLNDQLGLLVASAIAEARRQAYGTAAASSVLEGDYGTWDDWATLIRGVAAAAVAAERERCATIVDDLVRAVDGADALAAIRGA